MIISTYLKRYNCVKIISERERERTIIFLEKNINLPNLSNGDRLVMKNLNQDILSAGFRNMETIFPAVRVKTSSSKNWCPGYDTKLHLMYENRFVAPSGEIVQSTISFYSPEIFYISYWAKNILRVFCIIL